MLTAAYQLIVQERVQPALVVNETVSEIKSKEGEAPARFANAALRKIADHREQWRELSFKAGAPAAEAAAWASLPDWLWIRLCRDHGEDWARAYAQASLSRPVTWIRSRDPLLAVDWAKAGPISGAYELLEGGAVTEKPGFSEGALLVQDISSQRLVRAIAEEGKKRGARRALDLCAAPGGKSVGLAWDGLEVFSSDRDPARYALLKNSIERTHLEDRVKIVARSEVGAMDPLDLVWVDAPCTGTGILRRHPDVRWLRRENDLEGLLRLQQELLSEAWTRVRPGGLLAYSVCSVLKAEGPQALEKFLKALPSGEATSVAEWFFVPQEAPYGDGFWAGLVAKC